MSLSSDELNYLIWRYLQEVGLETSAFSLLKESPNVTRFDSNFGDRVPIGSLVSLIQKGLLYSHVDQLLDSDPQRFSLFEALNLEKSINKPIQFKDRFQLRANEDEYENDEINGRDSREISPDFVKVLTKSYEFEPSTCSNFNPNAPLVLAYGLKSGQAKIVVLTEDETDQKLVTLNHSSQDCDVTQVSWAPMGHLVLTALENGELRLWTADGKLRNVLYLHHSSVIVIKWSSDSNYILTTDVDNTTVIWSVQSGGMIQHFDLSKDITTNGQSTVPTPTVSTTSGSLTPLTAAAATTPVVASTSALQTPPESLGIDAAWIDNSRYIVPGLLGAALVFNVGDRSPQGSLIGHRKPLSVIEYDRESSLLLTASDDRTIRIWTGATFNNSIIFTGHSQPITSASWLNENFVISTSLDSSIRIWDLRKSAKEVFAEILDGIPILVAKLSSNKEYIVVGTVEATAFVFKIDLNEDLKLRLVAEYQSDIIRENSTKGVNSDEIMEDSGEADESNTANNDNEEGFVNENFITSLDWSSDSKQIVITYSLSGSVVVRA